MHYGRKALLTGYQDGRDEGGRKAGLCAEYQKPIIVRYDGEVVGEFVADIVVEDTIIVELKSVRRIVVAHEIQLVNYLIPRGSSWGWF
jgi:GxxExxY protein